MHRILALWATPRSVSTAFERMMIERADHTVFDEPFSAAYYFGPERVSDRFEGTLPGSRPDEILASLRSAAQVRPVFFKDMAAHAVPYLDASDLRDFVHTILVRDPRRALPSLARRWPDFTMEEAGYAALRELFTRARDARGEPPVVLEAGALRTSPEGVLRAWCDAVGIDFLPDALCWEPGMRPEWRLWREWYGTVAGSRGFHPAEETRPPEVADRRLAELIEECRPVYEELAALALEPVA